MKRLPLLLSLLLAVLVLGVVLSPAQTWRTALSATYPSVSFNDVFFVDATTLWAVGSQGTLLKSTDAGASWSGTSVDTLGTVTSVYFRTATEGYIGSSARKLYKTTDGGTSWTVIDLTAFLADADAVVRSVYFADASRGWILTTRSSANGRILRTTDGGATWNQDLLVAASNMIDMTFSGPDRGVATGKSTATLYYTKNGTTWTAAPAPTLSGATYTRSDIRGVTMVDSLRGYAVGWGSLVGSQASIHLKTTDGGETWTHLVQATPNRTFDNLYGVYFKDSLNGVAVGGATRGSVAARTSDGGVNWIPIEIPCGATLNGVAGNGNLLIVHGGDGVVLRSTDFGTTWDLKTSMPGATLYGLQFVSGTTGFGAGFDGLFVKTTDGGNSWKASFARANFLSPNINDLSFVDANTGFVACSYRAVMKTTNGGGTWSLVVPETTAAAVYSYAVHFVDQNLGFVAGAYGTSNGVIHKTTDGGASWSTKTNVIGKAFRGIAFSSATAGAAVGASRLAVYTTDGGGTWTPAAFAGVPATKASANLRKVVFLNASTAIAVGDSTILKSTDGGANWTYVASPASVVLNGVAFSSATTGYAVGSKQVLKTTNGGDTWTEVTDTTVHDETLNAVAVDAAGNPWVSGVSGTLTTTAVASDVAQTPETPQAYALEQNYPNPFNPSTVIRFSLPQASRVDLAVFNLIGQRVATLVEGTTLAAGEHSVRFNAQGLSSGVYFYKLTAGRFSQTRSMVLVR